MNKYIKQIIENDDSRYDNIEIMIFSNPDLQAHLFSEPNKKIGINLLYKKISIVYNLKNTGKYCFSLREKTSGQSNKRIPPNV